MVLIFKTHNYVNYSADFALYVFTVLYFVGKL